MNTTLYRALIASLIVFVVGQIGQTTVIAQEDAPQPPLTLFIGYDLDTPPDKVEQLGSIIASLQGQLTETFAAYEIETVFIEGDEPAELSITLVLSENLFVDLRMANPRKNFPSPFLLPHALSEIPLSGAPDTPELQDVITNTIVAFGAYIHGDCETTVTLLNHVIPLVDSVAMFADQLTAYLNFYLGNCALTNEEFEDAAAYYQTSLDIYRENGNEPHRLIGPAVNLAWIIFETMGDPGRALQLLELPSLPPYANHILVRALAMRAYIHAAQGHQNEAINVVNEAVALLENEPYPTILSGQIYLELGDVDGAWGEFDWAVKSFSKDFPEVYFHRGVFLVSIGEAEEALCDFEDYLVADPDGLFAREAQQHLDEMNGD